MNEIPKYKDVISLIPYGLPQFLDFEVPMSDALTKKLGMTFWEVLANEEQGEGSVTKSIRLHELHQYVDPETGEAEEDYFVVDEDRGHPRGLEASQYYTVNIKHIEPWLDRWIPVPFFRQSDDRHEDGGMIYLYGPTNWARAYLTRTLNDVDAVPSNWRLVLAFDMQVDDELERHTALKQSDVSESAICSLAYQKRDNTAFLNEGWVSEWLKSVYDAYYESDDKKKNRPRRSREDEDPDDKGEVDLGHLSTYLLYLQLLQKIMGKKSVRIAKIEEGSENPNSYINVDLILDIGNSRSTGILVEHLPDDNSESTLLNSYRLRLRDMTKPYLSYSEPFETRVEFSKSEFGMTEYSDRSERENAFAWASPVRTGPEATRLAALSVNAEGASGMSSPKRYLWDLEERDLWFFNKTQTGETEELVSSLSLCRYVNNCGVPIKTIKELKNYDQKRNAPDGEKPPKPGSIAIDFQNVFGYEIKEQKARYAMQPRFARSSLMMFLFMELIQQALITINTPAIRDSRGYSDRPRRLSTIIFTVPPGMPWIEKTIYATWAKAAVEVMWGVLGWESFYRDFSRKIKAKDKEKKLITDYRVNPVVKCSWDEATCTQLVYVYNEIKHNYSYDAELFFNCMGRIRTVEEADARRVDKPTLRVATIDVGGGSTDISVTTFVLANDQSGTNRIWPKQEIADGFSIGGDDVLRNIVSSIVVRNIAKRVKEDLEKKRGSNSEAYKVDEAMRAMFGQKSIDVRVQNLKVQFIRQLAIPAAYAVLSFYDTMRMQNPGEVISFRLADLFVGSTGVMPCTKIEKPMPEVLKLFSDEIKRRFDLDLDVLDIEFSLPCSEVDKAIISVVGPVMDSLGELVYAYDCDVLLVTGRPSCWNEVVRKVFSMMTISPDRVVPMHNYRVGSWYRFADEDGAISDPKTTVVMGAVLCQLAENAIEGFVFNSSRLKLMDNARYIGELNNQGVLTKPKIWFDLHDEKQVGGALTHVVDFSAPISIGFRQLDADRWSATKCWFMDFVSEEARQRSVGKTPYKVAVEFKIPDSDDPYDDKAILRDKVKQPNINYKDNAESVLENDNETVVSGRPIIIKPSTLSSLDERGCWMDTGVLYH